MKKIITKERICTALHFGYHLLFLGGTTTLGNYYLDEFEKTRTVIVQQMDRAENIIDNVKKTGDNLHGSVKSFEKEIKKVKKACGKIRF